MIEQRIKVNADIHAVPPIVSMVQEDTGRKLICELEDYTVTGAEGVALMCVRPDGTAYSYAGTANATDNTAEFDLDVLGGALSQAGMVTARVIMTIGTDIVSTFKFGIFVEEEIGGVATPDDKTFLEGLQAQLTAAISSYTVNGQAIAANTLLKSADFAYAVTGELMMASLTYTQVASW